MLMFKALWWTRWARRRWGPARTPDDLVVWVPQRKLLFAGEQAVSLHDDRRTGLF
jgi:hypothetical protein